MMPVVRRVTADDAGLLRETRLAALADAPWAFGSTLEREVAFTTSEWERRARESADGPLHATFVAEGEQRDGAAWVGLVGGHREHVGEPSVELVSMWVAPSARGQGVGEQLVQAVVDWATAAGASTVGLWVMRSNAHAARLYERAGFRPVAGFEAPPNDPCRDELRYELSLDSGTKRVARC